MIDFHSHILPAFDDGSESLAMSLDMLRAVRAQGVTAVVSTSHYYPSDPGSADHFTDRRDKALKLLRSAIDASGESLPRIYSGCELNLRTDISSFPDLSALCIEGTNYLLIEMPYGPWEDWMFECIYSLSVKGYRPVIAHVNRYLNHSGRSLSKLFNVAPVYQVNAEAFLNRRSRKALASLFLENHAHIIGSDMHNTSARAPMYASAAAMLYKKFGPEYSEYIERNGLAVLSNEDIDYTAYLSLPPLSGLQSLFL